MVQSKHIILLLLFCWVTGKSKALQTHPFLKFKVMNTTSFLPTNEIRNLYQDSEGYIWIATYNGLVRYDGYSAIVYKPSTKDNGKSIDGFVNIVTEDKEHRLWIGTHNGLYVLNKEMDDIEKIISPVLLNSYIEAVVYATNGDLWVGSNKGLFVKKSGKKHFEACSLVRGENTGMDIKSILEDKQGNIWIGTWERGLYRYDSSNGQFYAYVGLNPANSAHILFQDSEENIWIGTWRYGLMKIVNPYDMEKYSFIRYMHDDEDSNSLADNIIYSITEDRNSKKIWIGSRSGLSILESEDGKGTFTNFLPESNVRNLPFNEVDALLCGRDGLMWVGMLGGGVYTVNTRKHPFVHDPLVALKKSFPTNSVRSVLQGKDGNLWMGIMGFGLVLYNPQTQEYVPYYSHPSFKHLPYISTVNDIIYSRRRSGYYFATWDDGIWFFDGKDVKVINTLTYPKLTDVCIYSLLEDSSGNLWIGSRSGLLMLDSTGKLWALNELVANDKRGFPQAAVFKIVEDKDGVVWVTTATAGIWKISSSAGEYDVKHYEASENNIRSVGAMTLCVDSYNRLWAGTNGNGLNLYDRKQDRFISVLDEYFKDEEVIFSMQEDDWKTLWLTTNKGMYHIDIPIDKDSFLIHIYTQEDGLQDVFNRNACCKGRDGALFFGGVHGLNIFNHKDVKYDETSYPVVITDLKIYNTSVRKMPEAESDKILDKPLDYADHITLAYNQNNFSLDFSILNYVNPLLNKYTYCLMGYDKNWIVTNAHRHFAYYNNLPAGEYVFTVKGANSNGVWSSYSRTIKITVLPAPWFSWWAYCAYLVLALVVIWYLYRTVRNRIHLKQTIEMGNIQRQKLEEINHAKLQFFTNITHELLTPLSIISASVEELKLQSPDLKRKLGGISDNTTRLIRLIQQILEFRKVENGCQKLRVSKGNITLFLQQSISAFTPLVRKKKLRILFEGEDTEYKGYFDSDKLDKIVYNLLSNAAKYTPEGGTILLRQDYSDTEEKYIFSVNNSGEVIPNEKLRHLFDRFYEGEYRKFRTIGTGIGLSLTKDLVTLHRGTISVTSNLVSGNTFTVELPVARTAFPDDEVDEDSEAVNRLSEIDNDSCPDDDKINIEVNSISKGVTVLLVEDNADLREVVHSLLAKHFQVLEASNGKEALEVLEHQTVDIVISDIMMPEMDGLELCKKIKSKADMARIPVILLTAKTADADRVEGYEVGADGYICKPLNISILLAKIDNLLRKQEQADADIRKKLVFEAKELDYTPQDEEFLKKAIECVNVHLSDQSFDAATFIAEMGMSRTSFSDHLKKLTEMSPLAFISNVRLQAAYRLIQEKKKMRTADLAYAVGFNDPKYFSLCFKKKFGESPKAYMQKEE